MTIDADSEALAHLGYKQELRRQMSAFGNFALSFSVISILTGGISLYGYGLRHGGPIEMSLGWPLVSLMTLAVAISLAELASAFPTAGALYHWAATLGGRAAGWWAGWLNLVGLVGVVAGVDYALAELVCPLVGLDGSRWQVLAVYALLLGMHGALNHVGIRVVNALNDVSAIYHVVGTLLLIGVVLAAAPLRSPEFLLTRFQHFDPEEGRLPLTYALLVGLLQAQWTMTGFDASAHVAEETVGAQKAAPRGIVGSVVLSGVGGWIMLVVLTLAIRDLPATAAAPQPFQYLILTAVGPRLGVALLWMVIGAMWFCGLSSLTSTSRMLYAFARDGGVPGARWVAAVSPRWRTPAVAVWVAAAVALALAAWSELYSVMVSISTIGLYASYALPIWLALRQRRRGAWVAGPWSVGRWGGVLNVVAVVWTTIIIVLFVLPPNVKAGLTFAGVLVVLTVGWFAWSRRHFAGPPSLR